MTVRRYFTIVAISGVLGWISLFLVMTRLDPCTGPGIISLCHTIITRSLFLFFLSAFFALTATFTFLGWLLRRWLHGFELYSAHLTVSLRQGILLSICALSALALLLLNALTWWSGLLLIAIILLSELYFTRDLENSGGR